MKKKSLIAFMLLLSSKIISASTCPCYDCSENRFISQSFMFTRPISQNIMMRESAWHDLIHEKYGSALAAVQIVGLFQQSMKNEDTARYFLFNHKTCLSVMGDEVKDKNMRDIRAEWLGLPSNFAGNFSINPSQRQMGLMVEYNQDLKKFFGDSLFSNSWLSISIPLVTVESNLNFKQFDLQNIGTGDGPHDLAEAFNQKEWIYGKIDGKRSSIYLESIRIAFGSTYLSDSNFQVSYYSHFHINTASNDPAYYLFDAVAGSQGHHGMGAGVQFQIVLNKKEDPYDVCFFTGLEHTFLFRCYQKRMLDLIGKPWTRYLMLHREDREQSLNVPAINILTREVRARPYSLFDFILGVRIKVRSLELECGYGIWGHGDEKLELRCPFPTGYGIAGASVEGDEGVTRTANTSTITEQGPSDTQIVNDEEVPLFVSIVEDDLDLKSGASRSALNHHVHAVFSMIHKGSSVDGTFGLGFSYEVPQKNSALKTWELWGKIGAAF